MMPLIEAHRGDSSNAPENTLAAFQRAIQLGVPWIELDIHSSKDGTLMVIHDDTVNRTTNGSGAVSELDADALYHLDAGSKFSQEFSGERIPRLQDVLELVSPTKTRLNIEIKSQSLTAHLPETLVEMLDQFGKQYDYKVSSFDLNALLAVRAINPEITLALIGNGPKILNQAVNHQLPWIHAKHTSVTPEIVTSAHAQGICVNIWTMDDPRRYAYWQKVGVDKLCTNQPALMVFNA